MLLTTASYCCRGGLEGEGEGGGEEGLGVTGREAPGFAVFAFICCSLCFLAVYIKVHLHSNMAAAASTGYGSVLSLPDKFVGKDFSLFAMRASAVAEEQGFLPLMQQNPEQLRVFIESAKAEAASKVRKLSQQVACHLSHSASRQSYPQEHCRTDAHCCGGA